MAKRGPYWTDSGSDWRVARALETLANEFDEWLPEGATWNGYAVHGPSRRYVGTLGDSAHRAEGWENSDHNPFIRHDGEGIVRAMDVDFGHQPLNNYVRDRLSKMYWERDPRLYDRGYSKSNGRITANGSHGGSLSNLTRETSPGDYGHVHISVTRNGDSYNSACDSTAPWGFSSAPTPTPAPKPTPKPVIEEGDIMILVQVRRADYPGGKGWPGWFTFNGRTLTHVVDKTSLAGISKALGGHWGTISKAQFEAWK